MSARADTIDFADVIRALRRGWRTVAAYVLAGLLIALAVVLFAPKRFAGRTTIVVRQSEAGGGLLGRLTGMGGGDAAMALMGGKSQIETELQILDSRAVAAQVVDSLLLQARVRSPEGTPANRLLADVSLPGSFRKKTVKFRREGSGWRVTGAGVDTVVAAGASIPLLTGSITLATGALPESFRLQLLDREDAVTRFANRLSTGKAGGDVAEIVYRGDDSLTAAAAANAVVSEYLVRRRTDDRGVNQYRVEFLTAQLDSTERELAAAERALRAQQERSGILDPAIMGRVGLERAGELRNQLTQVQVEEGAMNQLLGQAERGAIDTRQLIAYPAFLRSASLNEMLGKLQDLEAERTILLERRTEADPEVVALTRSIEDIEQQFVPLARSYSQSLARQRVQLDATLDSLNRELGVLPGAAESSNRLTRDVLRLGTIFGAMQAQLVEARLAAIGEGGDVRRLDVAYPPKKPVFPRPVMTMAVGGSAGLMAGMVAALVLAAFGRWARDPREIERTTGVATLMFDRRAPLVVANGVMSTVLVIPLHERADAFAVATSLVETSLSRGNTATLLDLSARAPQPVVQSTETAVATPGAGRVDVAGTIKRLSAEFDQVVVRLGGLTNETTLAALSHERPVVFVVPPEPVQREQLVSAMDMLRRLDVPCAGVVISGSVPAGRAHALQS